MKDDHKLSRENGFGAHQADMAECSICRHIWDKNQNRSNPYSKTNCPKCGWICEEGEAIRIEDVNPEIDGSYCCQCYSIAFLTKNNIPKMNPMGGSKGDYLHGAGVLSIDINDLLKTLEERMQKIVDSMIELFMDESGDVKNSKLVAHQYCLISILEEIQKARNTKIGG